MKITKDISTLINAFGFAGNIEKFSALPHPWGASHTFECIVNKKKYVVKRWRGEDRIKRMQEENNRLVDLKSRGFEYLSAPIKTTNNSFYFLDKKGVAWTAYDYIDGGHVTDLNVSIARKAGKALANLHCISIEPEFNRKSFASRLHSLPEALDRMEANPKSATLAQKVKKEVLPKLLKESVLPIATIHGDFIFENILIKKKNAIMIDFEFSRKDYRLLDIAATVAPLRDNLGAYRLADKKFMRGFLESYSSFASTGAALQQNEISLIPEFSAAHFCFVYDDLTQGKSPYNKEALKVLEAILKGDFNWIKGADSFMQTGLSRNRHKGMK